MSHTVCADKKMRQHCPYCMTRYGICTCTLTTEYWKLIARKLWWIRGQKILQKSKKRWKNVEGCYRIYSGSWSAGWFPLPKGGGWHEYIRDITYRNRCRSTDCHDFRHKKITTPPAKWVWLFWKNKLSFGSHSVELATLCLYYTTRASNCQTVL